MKNNINNIILAVVICLYIMGCSNNENKNAVQLSTSSQPREIKVDKTKLLFEEKCARCHGSDGATGVANAANLRKSTLDTNSIFKVILNGKGWMTPFKNDLSEEEIHKLTSYVYSFRK